MRLLVLSDLHVEHVPFDSRDCGDGFDAVVLAGDVGQATLAVQWARRAFPHHPVVQIAGNHEYYDTRRERALDAMREAAHRLEVAFLERDEVEIGGVAFLGCTLWTDYRLHERPGRPVTMAAAEVMNAARRLMPDYRVIEVADPDAPGGMRPFSPEDSVADHEGSRAWLAARLAVPASGARVVVTHHLPSWRSVAPDYVAAPSNPAFASDVDPLFAGADVWIHGHTHSSHDYLADGCRVVCNPRGYPIRGGGFENPRFEASRIVDIPVAARRAVSTA